MRWIPLLVGVLLVAPLSAQRDDTAAASQFEVASIKAAAIPDEVRPRLLKVGGSCGLPGVERSGNRFRIALSQMCGLIRVAYDVADYQIQGIPSAEASNFFEVEARARPDAMPTMDETRVMLRALLAERFQLRVRREPREMPVFALTVANAERKVMACSNPDASSYYVPGTILSCRPPLPMARFLQFLSRETGRPVLDKTGLTTPYTFELRWLPEGAEPQPDSPPGLFTAIQEQLGWKLEAERGAVDTLVVEHAEAPSPN